MTDHLSTEKDKKTAPARSYGSRAIVLVGIMGAGKSSVGRRLADALGKRFFDSDDEIVKAANRSIPDIFAELGEEEFRRGEQRVIARLLDESDIVLATGGGAYMNKETRELIRDKAICVWLKADLEVLWKRVSRKSGRPLLNAPNPKKVLTDLLAEREPVYAEADIVVKSGEGPLMDTVTAILKALENNDTRHACE